MWGGSQPLRSQMQKLRSGSKLTQYEAACAVGAEQGVTCNKVVSMCNIFVRHDLQQIFYGARLDNAERQSNVSVAS